MTRSRRTAVAIVALALLAVTGFVAPTIAVPGADAGDAGSAPSAASAADGPAVEQRAATAQQQANASCDYTELYDETIDSVVTVQQRAGGQGSGFVIDVPGNDSDEDGGGENATAEDGSGTYVVTNAHVVGEASNVTIQFSRGETRDGTVVGTDVSSDLAVVSVDERPEYVEPLSLVDGDLEHGQRVAALGSPFGLDGTITHGIVSGLNRSMPTDRGYTIPDVVQTDAPISPGNSGGPLVTCGGAVAGVNSAGIAARGAENIGFAIPATTVERVVPSLVEDGEFQHPTLGVRGQTVTGAIAEANDLDVTQGVIVVEVSEDAPAADVLQGSDDSVRVNGRVVPVGGDVIVAVEGQPVTSTEDVASILLAETSPGDEVELTIVRDGEETTVTTTVTDRPEPQPGSP